MAIKKTGTSKKDKKRAVTKVTEEFFDYKNYKELLSFVTDRAKIVGRKRTGLPPRAQRKLARAIKRARYLGLLPYQVKIS